MSDPTTPNPYQAPQAPIGISADPSALPLASPWIRLASAIIDGVVLWPIGFILGKILLHTPTTEEAAEAIKKYGLDGAMKELMPSMPMIILINLIGLAIFIAVNFVFLKKGQTIGKMILKLQIQNRSTNRILPIQDILIKRVLPVYLTYAILYAISPFLTIILIVDSLCIFRPGRNTIHDDLAHSKVVKLPG